MFKLFKYCLHRESKDDDILERARTLFGDHFASATNFIPSSVFVATWDGVGYYDRKSDKVSTFISLFVCEERRV